MSTDLELAPPAWVTRALPKLDPPTEGGFPAEDATEILERFAPRWNLALALIWESYASILEPSPRVTAVNTGAQSVTYFPATPLGDYGLALQRAAWFRSQLGNLHSIQLGIGRQPPPFVWFDINTDDE